jgi:hypothetical protein
VRAVRVVKLWRCPNGCRGILAPEKLAKLDTRRWCLACSARSPMLVERRMPSAITAAARRIERRKASDARAEDREAARARSARRVADAIAAAPPAYPGPWLLSWLPVLEQLPWPHKLRLNPAKFSIRTRRPPRGRVSVNAAGVVSPSSAATHTTGTAWAGNGYVTLTAGTDRAEALAILLHEVAHLAEWRDGHGRRWRSAYCAAAATLTGAPLDQADFTTYDQIDIAIAGRIRALHLDQLERPSVDAWRAIVFAQVPGGAVAEYLSHLQGRTKP